MPNLPVDSGEMEAAIREAIVNTIDAVPDTGNVHDRERYRDSIDTWLRLFAIDDLLTERKVVRGAMVALQSFRPMRDAATCMTMPIALRYGLEFFYGFEDERSDGSNSTANFNAMLMHLWDAFEADHRLGYDELWHTSLDVAEGARLESFNGTICHVVDLTLECEVRR